MSIIRSFRGFTRHTLITFGKMRKKEEPKKNEERVRGGARGWVSFVTLEFASNIYATPATMETISVAWQPLCSRPVLPLASTRPPRPLFSPFPSQLIHSPFPLFHLALSVCLVWSNLPFSHLIGRETKTRYD